MNGPNSIAVTGAVKRFGHLGVLQRVDLHVEPGAVVALLGPSGCGKTTLLRSIAGLERLDGGEIRIGERVVSGRGTHVPPERRRVGMVFQDWALFPHLTVAQNVGYGLPRRERSSGRVDAALTMVGLEGLGGRSPTTLSGGQQQRVALARALAPEPGVLLLDEPFSNLDSTLRVQVRTEVHQLLARLGVTTLFVTHDQEEAFVLGDEVAVMQGGEIVQQASPSALYARPASPWVATFVGDANLVDGTASAGLAATPVGSLALETPLDGRVQVVVRPEDLRLAPLDRPDDGGNGDRNGDATVAANGGTRAGAAGAGNGAAEPPCGAGTPATVELCEFYGHDTVYLVRPDGGGPLRARAGSAPLFDRGDRVIVAYHGAPAVAYPATGGDATGGAAGQASTPAPPVARASGGAGDAGAGRFPPPDAKVTARPPGEVSPAHSTPR